MDKIHDLKGEIFYIIRKAHTSKVVGDFGIGKTIANLLSMCIRLEYQKMYLSLL